MKTVLLKKIREKHPIYFNSNTKLYKYETEKIIQYSGGISAPYYESEWVEDYKTLLKKRRELVLMDSSSYFFTRFFCYKRKRAREIKRIF